MATKRPVPHLPDPVGRGQYHSPENRRRMAQRFITQAHNELMDGNRLQAGEKAWGAVAQHLKLVGEARGWSHTNHRQVESIGRHIRAEYPELDSPTLADAMSDAYHVGHANFYENQRTHDEITDVVEIVERTLPSLERLATEAAQNPRPFEITSGSEARRLREVTGNRELQIGDKSSVGFSRKHGPDSSNNGGGSNAAPSSNCPI